MTHCLAAAFVRVTIRALASSKLPCVEEEKQDRKIRGLLERENNILINHHLLMWKHLNLTIQLAAKKRCLFLCEHKLYICTIQKTQICFSSIGATGATIGALTVTMFKLCSNYKADCKFHSSNQSILRQCLKCHFCCGGTYSIGRGIYWNTSA